ncbi:MAG: TIGR01212 family radical SAM protein [Streptococcaceae bacterium]|jgi:radical SAM protein (TIGR01212 family)|nr:TIGR01212 family radical SAM protein [Streptococcaceae bacterium]
MDNKRYYTFNKCLKQHFGFKVFKVPINAGFSCPNRDGKVAFGGCTFCNNNGSGGNIAAALDSLPLQFQKAVFAMHKKWPNVKQYIVYFQNFTNTYACVKTLRKRYEQVISLPGVVGLSIGTRPDCLPFEVIDYLAELNQRLYLWVELGLQSTFDLTNKLINRAHSYQTYLRAVKSLRKHNIRICTHLINGLPKETKTMMLENVRRTLLDSDIQGIKLHLLQLMKNTAILRDYNAGQLRLMDKKDYIDIIVRQLEIIPENIVIHRLTGDALKNSLIAPMWSLKKWEVLNAIDNEMIKRGTWQGKYALKIR